VKKYSAVIFDWDGTIMDSTFSIVSSLQAACREVGLPIPDKQQASWVIGLSLDRALYHCVPDLTEQQLPQFLAAYRKHYYEVDKTLRLFEGMNEVLDALGSQQTRLAVATGKSRRGLDRALAQSALTTRFHTTRCADETAGKPDPQMLYEILEELALQPEEVLMVGDTTHDIHMAHSAGIDSMAVTYGAHDPATLAGANPLIMVDTVNDLRQWMFARLI